MRRLKYFIYSHIIFGLIIFFLSCSKQEDECFKPSGKVETTIRSVGNFTSIKLDGQFSAQLVQDSMEYVEVTYGSNKQAGIHCQVENNILSFKDNNNCKWFSQYGKPVELKIHFKELKYISMDDNSKVFSLDTIRSNELTIDHKSTNDSKLILKAGPGLVTVHQELSGNMELSGVGALLVVVLDDVSSFEGRDYFNAYTYCYHSGTGNLYTHSSYVFEANISYTGNVYYKGNPFFSYKTNISGTGQVIKLD